MAGRADPGRVEALMHENAVLARSLAAAQQRCARLMAEHAERLFDLQRALQAAQRDLVQFAQQAARDGTPGPATGSVSQWVRLSELSGVSGINPRKPFDMMTTLPAKIYYSLTT